MIGVMDGRAVNDGRGEGDGRRCDDYIVDEVCEGRAVQVQTGDGE